jgi:NADH-quinone oxidoreductase subunit L
MAVPLVVLAIGSVLAGYVGVPHALGGHNEIEGFLHPSFAPFEAHGPAVAGGTHGEAAAAHAAPTTGHEADEAGKTRIELTLMGVSTVLAFVGVGIAAFFFLRRPDAADNAARAFAPVHRTLLDKYYVDEFYDAVFVAPIKGGSERVLWKGVDVGLIDGAVNGVGHLVRSSAGALRRLQTGSVRTSAASLFVGVLLVLGYYLAR